ncbi:MAG TPA: TetR family transcriptional regulator [Pseudonocardiaceae bacterium]|nr:TetR family transcriptional regulator [Pseudonocardiaceae bacterium]
MARWDPGAEDRLRKAALELFGEHGYDNVTVTQIAERAGLTRRSFFRYFPDKREVLFAGSEQLPIAVADAVRGAPESAAPLAAVLAGLGEVVALLVERVDGIAQRRAVIEASAELQERERTKAAAVTDAIRAALVDRGVAGDEAKLLAEVASVAFQNAFARWVAGGGVEAFEGCLDQVAGSLRESFLGLSR